MLLTFHVQLAEIHHRSIEHDSKGALQKPGNDNVPNGLFLEPWRIP
jgi:hypothetical protein